VSCAPVLKNSQNRGKCHAELCAELDSVLFQHLIKSMRCETLKRVQGDSKGFLNLNVAMKRQSSVFTDL